MSLNDDEAVRGSLLAGRRPASPGHESAASSEAGWESR